MSSAISTAPRVALVTGAAQGIGRAIATLFLQRNWHVITSDIDAEAGHEGEQRWKQEGVHERATFVKCDVTKEDEVKNMFEVVQNKYGYLDTLVNNAGVFIRYTDHQPPEARGFEHLSYETFKNYIDINLNSVFLCSKYAVPLLRKSPHHSASIINIGSTRALMSEMNTEPYSAGKGGVVSLTHAMAMSLQKDRIRVNCISPGWIDVTGLQKSTSAIKQMTFKPSDHEFHPCGRIGNGNDIGEMALFLADASKSGFVTGQNYHIDGGVTKKMIYEHDFSESNKDVE